MRARAVLLISMLLTAGVVARAAADSASSPGATRAAGEGTFTKSPDKAVRVLLIEGVSSTAAGAALSAAAIPYDYYQGSAWAGLNLSIYNQVFIALDGSYATDADCLAIANFAAAGGAVHLLGGSNDLTFTTAVNARLIGVDTATYSWATNTGSPDVLRIDALSYLARGMAPSYDRVGGSYYSLRITDSAAHVVATNSDGRTVMATKKIGAGRLDVWIYSPGTFYYTDANDKAQFNRMIANMAGGTAALPQVLVLGNANAYVSTTLSRLGVPWESSSDANWAPMDLSPYRHVVVAQDGGTPSIQSVQNLGTFVTAGGTLDWFGGSALSNFTGAVNSYLLLVDTVNYTWGQSTASPQVANLLPDSRLGFRLAASFNFNEPALTYYQLRVTDPAAAVVARNAAGLPILVTRERGAGTINLFTGPPDFFNNTHDQAWLWQVLANMINTDAPAITSVADIPRDQGGAVRLRWRGVWQDANPSPTPIASYSIWRRAATGAAKGLPGGTWDFLASVPAQRLSSYQAVVPTLCDSTASGVCRTVFAVSAVASNGSTFFYSLADSGCSVDNLAPSVPAAFTRLDLSTLGWGDPVDPDFRYFTVYGSNNGVFDGTVTVVGHSTGRSQGVAGLGWHWYYLTATDYAGNESDAASLNGLSAVPGAVPTAFALHGPTPNPFNPRTELRFDLPVASRVALAVYDVSGRLVRTLVADEQLEAGAVTRAWDGRDDHGRMLPAGAYLVRLRAGGFTQTRTAMLLK